MEIKRIAIRFLEQDIDLYLVDVRLNTSQGSALISSGKSELGYLKVKTDSFSFTWIQKRISSALNLGFKIQWNNFLVLGLTVEWGGSRN